MSLLFWKFLKNINITDKTLTSAENYGIFRIKTAKRRKDIFYSFFHTLNIWEHLDFKLNEVLFQS